MERWVEFIRWKQNENYGEREGKNFSIYSSMLIWQIVQSRWVSSPTPHLLNPLSFMASNNLHYSFLLSSLQQPLLTSSSETNILTVFTVGWVCLFHNNLAFYTNICKQGGNTNEGRARNLAWLCRSIDLPPSVMSSFQPSVNTPTLTTRIILCQPSFVIRKESFCHSCVTLKE